MKAKTKFSLITVLNAILCVVFAFIASATYAASGVTRTESNLYSTGAYAVNNNYKLINSTKDNPVLFGETTNNVKIALNYSVYYDFDIRIDYTLSWSNGLSTDNVVLNFPNRDGFIVDDEYIYLTTAISSGNGTLNIIDGVEFIDPTDENYVGASLTISTTLTLVKQTAIDYTSNDVSKNPLYVDSIAGNAWFKLKSGEIANNERAEVIVYNSRYNTDMGISHPAAQTALKDDATRLYGNRYYAGAAMYVMTGSKAVEITVKSLGSWQFVGEYEYRANTLPVWQANTYYSKTEDYVLNESTNTPPTWKEDTYYRLTVVDDENNYELLTEQPSDWNTNYTSYYYYFREYAVLENEPTDWQTPAVYTQYYTKSGETYIQNSIPQWTNDRYYKKLSDDSFEKLTTQPDDWNTNYTSYYYIYAPAAFDNNIFYNFNQNVGWGTISYSENNATSTIVIGANKTVYIPIFDSIEITSVMNTTSGLLVDYKDYKLTSTFNLNGNSIKNKITTFRLSGSDDVTETLQSKSYTLLNNTLYNPGLYDVSANESQTYYVNLSLTNNTNTTKTYTVSLSTRYTRSNGAFNMTSSSGPADSLSNTLLSGQSAWARVSNIYGDAETIVVKVAPYSTVSIANKHTVPQALAAILESYDAWIDYAVDVQETGSTEDENSIAVESTLSNGSMKYYIRNNSDKTVAVPASTLSVKAWTYSYSPDQTEGSSLAEWEKNYWKYYYKDSNGKYVQAVESTQWQEGKFYTRFVVSNTVNLTISAQTLVPNASILIGEVSQTQTISSNEYTMDRFVSNCSISAPETKDTVGIVNSGTSSAYLVNASTQSYYVRFTGTCTDDNVVTENGYNYYIGIIRPGQIVDMPMTGAGVVTDVIAATGSYSSTTLNVWSLDESSSSVLAAFNTFFN